MCAQPVLKRVRVRRAEAPFELGLERSIAGVVRLEPGREDRRIGDKDLTRTRS